METLRNRDMEILRNNQKKISEIKKPSMGSSVDFTQLRKRIREHKSR